MPALLSAAVSMRPVGLVARGARPARGASVILAAKRLDDLGVIEKDNSGRSNIFPTASKAFYESPTSSAVASTGLGGVQGAGIVAAALAIVALATAGVISNQGTETLAQVSNGYTGDSLTAIASRLSK